MSRPANHGKPWTPRQKKIVVTSARQGITTLGIARKVHRTTGAVRAEASRLNQSLKPKD